MIYINEEEKLCTYLCRIKLTSKAATWVRLNEQKNHIRYYCDECKAKKIELSGRPTTEFIPLVI